MRNTGKRAGDETVQTYVRDKASSVTRPVKDLRAFKRITLAAGASQKVTFTPDEQAFRMWKAV